MAADEEATAKEESKIFRSPTSQRTIRTTVKESEFQSPLAREIAGLEKFDAASSVSPSFRGGLSPVDPLMQKKSASFLSSPPPSTSPVKKEESPSKQSPPPTPTSILFGPSTAVSMVKKPYFAGLLPTKSQSRPTAGPPSMMERKASASNFLGYTAAPAAEGRGRTLGVKQRSAETGNQERTTKAAETAAAGEPDRSLSRQRSAIVVGKRQPSVSTKKTEEFDFVRKEKMSSFFAAPEAHHRATPTSFLSSVASSPKSQSPFSNSSRKVGTAAEAHIGFFDEDYDYCGDKSNKFGSSHFLREEECQQQQQKPL